MNFHTWLQHFKLNQNHFHFLEFTGRPELSNSEKNCIRTSIQQFQKGENSEGKNLIHFAKAFGNEDYLAAIKLFIKEEQNHALILAAFMKQEGIPKIKQHWVDSVFRGLRKFSTLHNSIIVLSTAELIANTYYKALLNATNSKTLKEICKQILFDENMHLSFQAYTLKILNQSKPVPVQYAIRFYHRLLLMGTIVLVYQLHKSVLIKGQYNLISFYNAVFADFEVLSERIKNCPSITNPSF